MKKLNNYDRFLISSMSDELGEQYIYKFENGYGASVIRNPYSYGKENGKWEIATITFPYENQEDLHFNISYDIWDDVQGYLTWEKVEMYLNEIYNFIPKKVDEDIVSKEG